MKYLYALGLLPISLFSLAMENDEIKPVQKPLSRSGSSTDLTTLADKNSTPESPLPPELLQQDTGHYVPIDFLVKYILQEHNPNVTPLGITSIFLTRILNEIPVETYNTTILESMPFFKKTFDNPYPNINYKKLNDRPTVKARMDLLVTIVKYLALKDRTESEAMALEDMQKQLQEYIEKSKKTASFKEQELQIELAKLRTQLTQIKRESDRVIEVTEELQKRDQAEGTGEFQKKEQEVKELQDKIRNLEVDLGNTRRNTDLFDLENALQINNKELFKKRYRIGLILTSTGCLVCFACAAVASYFAIQGAGIFRSEPQQSEA